MGQLKFISREKLVEYLDEELRQFFNDHGIYEINQYGWLSDDEQDSDYRGHAIWQEDPPELNKLVGLGDEFSNLMKSARQSLGLAFLYHDASDSLVNDSGYAYSYHFADTISKLSLASDRIRDFFIAAFAQHFPDNEFCPPASKLIQEVKVSDHFRIPFKQTYDEVLTWSTVDHPLQECLAALLPLTEDITRNRSANQMPFHHIDLFHARITDAVTNQALGYPDEALPDNLSCAADSSSQELVSWYDSLVKVSNQVFLAEHLLRHFSGQVGTVPALPRKHKTS
jgi:hypothetical protein